MVPDLPVAPSGAKTGRAKQVIREHEVGKAALDSFLITLAGIGMRFFESVVISGVLGGFYCRPPCWRW